MKALAKRKPLGESARVPLKGSQGRVGPSKSTQRKPLARPNSTNRQRGPQPLTVEMIDTLHDAIEGAVYGDFSQDQSAAKLGGQIAIGFVPILGQLADIRDMIAAGKKIYDGEAGGWSDLGFASLGLVPGFDAFKGMRKAATGMAAVPPSKVRKALPKPTRKGKAAAKDRLKKGLPAGADYDFRSRKAREIAEEIMQKPGVKPEEMGGLATITDRVKFRREVQRELLEDPNHPLWFLLTEEGTLLPGGLKGIGMKQWMNNPDHVEAAHGYSLAGIKDGLFEKTDERLALQSTYLNRWHGGMEGKGRGYAEAFIRINIGGFPVDLETAVNLATLEGKLTFEDLKEARVILDPPTKIFGRRGLD